jgi:hypothetical protein
LKVSNGFEKGRIFDFQTDLMNAKFTFDSKITSTEKFVEALNSKINFETDKIVVKGLNLGKINKALKLLKKSKGVKNIVNSSISTGSDTFSESYGNIEINRGKAKFVDVFFNSENISLTLNNVTSIPKWDLNAKLVAEFIQSPNLPKLEITMKDSITIPSVEADYSKIEEYYKSIEVAEAKKIKEEENRKKAELRRITSEKVNIIVSQRREVSDLFNNMKAEIVGVKDKSILEKSQKVEKLYESIVNNIDATEAINRKPEITEELFVEVEDYYLANNKSMDEIREEVNDITFSCLRMKARKKMDVIISNINKANESIDHYREVEISKTEDLSKISKIAKFSGNPKYNEFKNNLEIYISDLYSKQDIATIEFDKSKKSRIVEEMKLYISNLDDLLIKISVIADDVRKTALGIEAVVKDVVDNEVAKQKERLKKIEVEKRIEESKGSLSVRGSVKKFSLTEDEALSKIEGKKISNDNVASETSNIKNEDNPVLILDFTKKDNVKQKDNLGVEKSGKVYRF